MNKIAYFGIILLSILSCKTATLPIDESSKSNTPMGNNFEKGGDVEHNYFKSIGTEPF